MTEGKLKVDKSFEFIAEHKSKISQGEPLQKSTNKTFPELIGNKNKILMEKMSARGFKDFI